jgi:tetratricopeptide (TPR) repeat protein
MQNSRMAIPIALGSILLAGTQVGCDRSPQAREKRFLDRAEKLAGQKEYARALLELRNASLAMPKDAEPHYRMAVLELLSKQTPAAIRDLGKALELNPKHEQAKVKLAELMAMDGNRQVVEGAEKQLREVLAASPGNLEAVDTLAFTQWRLGRPEDAAALLEESLAKVPTRFQTSVALARVRLSRNDVAGAEQVLVAATVAAPQSSPAALALSRFYILVKKADLAKVEARKAVELDPHSGLALLTLGNLQSQAGEKVEAEETYRRLSALPDATYKSVHAIYLFENGRRPEAIAELGRLHKASPEDRTVTGQFVAAYLANGQAVEARGVVDAAVKRNPKDVDALMMRATLSLRDGKTAEADRDLQLALHIRRNSAEVHFALARLYTATGRAQMERQELQEVLRLNPGFLKARLALARNYTQQNQAGNALQLLNDAPAGQRQMQAVIIERNWALKAKKDWATYGASVEEGLKLGRSPELVLQDGLAKLNSGDFAGARANAEEILKQLPEDANAAGMLAASYMGQKQTTQAVDALRTLAEAHPKSAPIRKIYGDLLKADGNMSAAREAYRTASALDQKYLGADFGLAGMDISDQQMDAARQTLNGVLRKSPGNATALLLLGGLESDPASAMNRYRAVLETDPKNVTALNNLAYLMANTDPDGALPYAQQAIEIAPDSAMIQDTIGWIYYRKGAYATAVPYLEKAVAKEPNPRRQFHLAVTYIKHGESVQGRALLTAALAKDPELTKTEVGW